LPLVTRHFFRAAFSVTTIWPNASHGEPSRPKRPELAQFAVNQRHQLIHRCLIAFAPGQEQLLNFVWIWIWHLTAALSPRSLKKTFTHVAVFLRNFRMK
jgi:hypothetical protein